MSPPNARSWWSTGILLPSCQLQSLSLESQTVEGEKTNVIKNLGTITDFTKTPMFILNAGPEQIVSPLQASLLWLRLLSNSFSPSAHFLVSFLAWRSEHEESKPTEDCVCEEFKPTDYCVCEESKPTDYCVCEEFKPTDDCVCEEFKPTDDCASLWEDQWHAASQSRHHISWGRKILLDTQCFNQMSERRFKLTFVKLHSYRYLSPELFEGMMSMLWGSQVW